MATMIKSDPRAREKPCIRCGYSLRKVTDSNHCPECGLSVWLSLNQNDTLEMCNPAWIRRMALRVGLMFLALLPAVWVMAVASVQEVRYANYRQQFVELRDRAQD